MPEQNVTRIDAEKAALSLRSHLLTPIIDGHALEVEDVSSFLAGRLSMEEEEGGRRPDLTLS
jgi:hypothetical protein